jgi:hypothetical protein
MSPAEQIIQQHSPYMAYMPGDKEVDSQELDLFKQYNNSSVDDMLDEIGDGVIIANLQYISRLASTREATHDNNANVNNGVKDGEDDAVVLSPGRLPARPQPLWGFLRSFCKDSNTLYGTQPKNGLRCGDLMKCCQTWHRYGARLGTSYSQLHH